MINIEVIIYWDILSIINFAFDFMTIYLTACIASVYIRIKRCVIAAAILTLSQMILMVTHINNIWWLYILLNICNEIIIVLMVFGKMKLKKCILMISIHMGITFLMGGIITAFYDKIIAYKRHQVSIIELFLIGTIAFLLIKNSVPLILRSIYYREKIYEVMIRLKGKEIRLKALLDTGNSLTEPTTGKKVTVVEKKIISSFNDVKVDKIYIIPYKSLGKENGILYGIQVDEIIIKYDNYQKTLDNAIVGIYNGKLSRDNRYNAILHSESLV